MLRFSFLAFLAVAAIGCGGELELDGPAPLLVIDTFPASGASVDPVNLETLSVTFSRDLGAAAPTDSTLLGKFRLRRKAAGQEDFDLAPLELGTAGYHRDSMTLQFEPDAGMLAVAATPGSLLRLTVGAGLASEDGAELPADVNVLFWIADRDAAQ